MFIVLQDENGVTFAFNPMYITTIGVAALVPYVRVTVNLAGMWEQYSDLTPVDLQGHSENAAYRRNEVRQWLAGIGE